MNFDWTEYLYQAQELARTAAQARSEEANLRSAISRAYYAAFISARNYLRDHDHNTNIPKSGAAHEYVRKQFADSRRPARRRVGRLLYSVRMARRLADYKDEYPKLEENARRALAEAWQIIIVLRNLR